MNPIFVVLGGPNLTGYLGAFESKATAMASVELTYSKTANCHWSGNDFYMGGKKTVTIHLDYLRTVVDHL